jgi:hypothetical protein
MFSRPVLRGEVAWTVRSEFATLIRYRGELTKASQAMNPQSGYKVGDSPRHTYLIPFSFCTNRPSTQQPMPRLAQLSCRRLGSVNSIG